LIYPTRTAVAAAAVGAPLALVLAAVEPGKWFLALAWPLAVLALVAVDAMRGIASGTARLDIPGHAYVGETRDCKVTVSIERGVKQAFVALQTSPLVAADDDGRVRVQLENDRGASLIPLEMLRRGVARFERVWLRWTGPLGLAWNQGIVTLDTALPIVPDLRPTLNEGAQIFKRYAIEGLLTPLARGEGADFDALVEFQTGMDRRSIDWKQSGRHMKLLAKQYRTERNNQIVFAIDSGRQMCEPIAGLPRVDRCISAMLLTAWVALKLGDRVALNAFDSRPRLASGLVSGSRAFADLQRIAAEIDYSAEETNYTFALTMLAARLMRRSMIILFTEFTDTVSADFLLRAIRRLVETHIVVLIVMRDEELEELATAKPQSADDITRAITAFSLLNERRLVISRLQHLGVHIVECEHDKVNERLVQSYLQLKKRDLL
jgi:uncharacterized protein (DUF58 family)